jgi:hypothetical protein
MSGKFSREAFAARLNADVMADIDRIVADAPPPSPELVAHLRRIFAPAVNRLAHRPEMADAAGGQEARAA